jgi:4-hydroxy-4-methyl-2-oxoglutarate aldolase
LEFHQVALVPKGQEEQVVGVQWPSNLILKPVTGAPVFIGPHWLSGHTTRGQSSGWRFQVDPASITMLCLDDVLGPIALTSRPATLAKRPNMIDVPPLIQRQPFARPASDQVQALRGTPTGFIVDAMGGSGALDYRLRPAIAEQYAFCGVALTVDAGPGDNLALVHALQDVQPGDVLMASTGGFTGCAITGDLVLGMAKNCGAVGFVTDGCVRDLVGLRAVGLPAWAVGVTPNSPQRHRPGTIGFAIALAGHPVASGDIVVADLDGVVVVPQARLAEVLARLPQIRAAEARADAAVRDGAKLPSFLVVDNTPATSPKP